MIEAANSDGNIDENEIKKIKEALINIFKESPDDVDKPKFAFWGDDEEISDLAKYFSKQEAIVFVKK